MEDFKAIESRIQALDAVFYDHLFQMYTLARTFASFASNYDVNQYFKMNGYRSMIQIVAHFFSLVRRVAEGGGSQSAKGKPRSSSSTSSSSAAVSPSSPEGQALPSPSSSLVRRS